MIRSFHRLALLTLIGISFSSFVSIDSAYANYKRCWIENGVATINCNPADSYYYVKENKEKNEYKKCPVRSGWLKNKCKQEDGFAMMSIDHRWYQCPIQGGKKIDDCTLATGYYTIFVPQLPLL